MRLEYISWTRNYSKSILRGIREINAHLWIQTAIRQFQVKIEVVGLGKGEIVPRLRRRTSPRRSVV